MCMEVTCDEEQRRVGCSPLAAVWSWNRVSDGIELTLVRRLKLEDKFSEHYEESDGGSGNFDLHVEFTADRMYWRTSDMFAEHVVEYCFEAKIGRSKLEVDLVVTAVADETIRSLMCDRFPGVVLGGTHEGTLIANSDLCGNADPIGWNPVFGATW